MTPFWWGVWWGASVMLGLCSWDKAKDHGHSRAIGASAAVIGFCGVWIIVGFVAFIREAVSR